MSIFEALVNPRKSHKVVTTSVATAASAASVYVTLYPWFKFARLTKLTIAANQAFSNLTVNVYKGSAQYRNASTADKPQYILDKLALSGTSVTWAQTDADTLTEDPTRAGCLYLELTTSGTFTTGTVFTVTAEGYELTPHALDASEQVPWKSSHGYKALTLVSGASLATDLTPYLCHAAHPQYIGQEFTLWASTGDYLYLGSTTTFDKVFFQLGATTQPAGSTFTFAYWNGSSWASFTPLDNTSDGQTSPSHFSYSGPIGLPTLSGWSKTQITEDPTKIMVDEIEAGDAFPLGGGLSSPDRYWIRITPSSFTGPQTGRFVVLLK